MKRLSVCIAFIFSSVCVFAQTGAIQGFCTQGAVSAVTSGSSSANTLQGVIAGCTVTVYLHGTTTLATIYKDGNGTPLSNPFTANLASATNAGGWIFYAATSQGMDIFGSGGGGNPSCTTQPKCYAVSTPLAVAANGSGGGGGGNQVSVVAIAAPSVMAGTQQLFDAIPSVTPVCDIRTQGAVIDGVTDIGPAVQACVNLVNSLNGASGTILFPCVGSGGGPGCYWANPSALTPGSGEIKFVFCKAEFSSVPHW